MEAVTNNSNISYGFGPLVEECKRRGIGRTVAFELAKSNLIETFSIGRKRYVRLQSLESLPERLAKANAENVAGE